VPPQALKDWLRSTTRKSFHQKRAGSRCRGTKPTFLKIDAQPRIVLDINSTEIPVCGQQENSAHNGHFESTCYHPLLLFNREGDCLAAELRPGNVHSADDWEKLLLPEIERQQKLGKEVVFRADAAFAKPEIYEALEQRNSGSRKANRPSRWPDCRATASAPARCGYG